MAAVYTSFGHRLSGSRFFWSSGGRRIPGHDGCAKASVVETFRRARTCERRRATPGDMPARGSGAAWTRSGMDLARLGQSSTIEGSGFRGRGSTRSEPPARGSSVERCWTTSAKTSASSDTGSARRWVGVAREGEATHPERPMDPEAIRIPKTPMSSGGYRIPSLATGLQRTCVR